METLTLLQTGKRDPLPLILLDEPGGTYWARWISFVEKELMSRGYISESDFELFDAVESAEEAVQKIRSFYGRYHSLRYVGERLVLRLTSSPAEADLERLREQFADILVLEGNLFVSGPLPEESDEPELAGLPRMILDFNRKEFGRLRALINAVNACI
jgi:hypothetical protein